MSDSIYPKTVILENPKLRKLLEEKNLMVLEGRELSTDIEELEEEMKLIDEEIQKQENKAEVADLKAKANELADKMKELVNQMEDVRKTLYGRARELVDKNLIDDYENKKKLKEEKEEKRRKLALKVQKKNDLIIPLSRKLMKPTLRDEFDDYYSLVMENDKITGTIFNHLEEFKTRFREKNKK
jgi:hypothetical protein